MCQIADNERSWVVIGCGGHGREVADVLKILGQDVIGFLDDNPDYIGRTIAGLPTLGPLQILPSISPTPKLALGIGDSFVRKNVVRTVKDQMGDYLFPPIIHPQAWVGSRVHIQEGTLVQAGCILTCDIQVGAFVVLNVGTTISHDSRIGDFSTLAPGARLAGNVKVGNCVEIGMGTLVIQNLRLEDNSRTGAGAVVIRDVLCGQTVVGVPAKPISHRISRVA